MLGKNLTEIIINFKKFTQVFGHFPKFFRKSVIKFEKIFQKL